MAIIKLFLCSLLFHILGEIWNAFLLLPGEDGAEGFGEPAERAVSAGGEAEAAEHALPVRQERPPSHLLRLRPVRRRVKPLVRGRYRR